METLVPIRSSAQPHDMPPPPSYLMPELIVKILVRLSPDDPARLVRASLVCKLWRRLLCDHKFRSHYISYHRVPPLLGFICSHDTINDQGKYITATRFVPKTTPSPLPLQAFDNPYYYAWRVLDCRHGHVVFNAHTVNMTTRFAVWDHATCKQKELPDLPLPDNYHCAAAVLCAVRGCDHLDCRGGPFLVVFVCSDPFARVLQSHVYSSETSTWSSSKFQGHRLPTVRRPSVLIGDHIHFILASHTKFGIEILNIDLRNNHLSIINPPDLHDFRGKNDVLIATEDSSLGVTEILGHSKLCVWSRNVVANSEVVGGWVPSRVIEFETLIPSKSTLRVVGSAEGSGIIFVDSDVGVFSLDVKSGRVRKVDEPRENIISISPFVSFYIPVMAPASESEHSVLPDGEQNGILNLERNGLHRA